MGPRLWFGLEYENNVSFSGQVFNNNLTGAFGYGMGLTSARNFTVEGNILVGNTSFIGSRGPNCSSSDTTPTPAPFVTDPSFVFTSTIQSDFQTIPDGNSLTCILPPEGGDYWPFGGNPSNPVSSSSGSAPTSSSGAHTSSGLSAGAKAGIAIGVILGVLGLAIATFFVRRWALHRALPPPQPWQGGPPGQRF